MPTEMYLHHFPFEFISALECVDHMTDYVDSGSMIAAAGGFPSYNDCQAGEKFSKF